MRKFFSLQICLLVLLFVESGCEKGEDHFRQVQIQTARNVIQENPSTALSLLEGINKDKLDYRDRMRYELLRVEANDRLFNKQSSDSIMKEVTIYFENYGDDEERVLTYYYLGSCYRDLKNYPEALDWYYKAYRLIETKKCPFEKERYLALFDQICYLLSIEDNFEEELRWYKRILSSPLFEKDDFQMYHNIGEAYMDNGYKDTATLYFDKSFSLMQNMRNWTDGMYMGVSTQIAYFLQEDDTVRVGIRLPYFRRKIAGEGTGVDLHNYAMYKEKIGELDSAKSYYKRALGGHSLAVRKSSYEKLFHICVMQNKLDSAVFFTQKYIAVSDSLKSLLEEERILKMSRRYEYEDKQRENLLLRDKNIIFYKWMIVLFIVLLALCVVGAFLWMGFRRSRMEVKSQKRLLKVWEEECVYLDRRASKLEQKFREQQILNGDSLETLMMRFHLCAERKQEPSSMEWKTMLENYRLLYPKLMDAFERKFELLPISSIYLCLLTLSGFKGNEMTALLGMSRQYLYSLRLRISMSLSGRECGRNKEFLCMLREFANKYGEDCII